MWFVFVLIPHCRWRDHLCNVYWQYRGVFELCLLLSYSQFVFLPSALSENWKWNDVLKPLKTRWQLYLPLVLTSEDNLHKTVYLLYNISKEYNLEIATKKTKVFDFVGTDHLWTNIIINDETLEKVSQFTYLGCSISHQFSNYVEFKLAKFLQLIGIIKRAIFKKVRTETILKI